MRVLFISGDNSSRSQMAEGLLRAMADSDIQVMSAGVTSSFLHPMVVEAMQEIGIDISSQKSKAFSKLDVSGFSLQITLCEASRDLSADINKLNAVRQVRNTKCASNGREILSPFSLHWKIDDPTVGQLSDADTMRAIRQVRDQIRERINRLIDDGYLEAIAKQREVMKHMLGLMEGGLLAHDDARKIFIFNDEMERITGLSCSQVLGRDCHEVFPPDGLCGSQCRFKNGPSQVKEQIKYRIPVNDADGIKKTLKVSASPLVVNDDIPSGVFALVKDVTEFDGQQMDPKDRKNFHGMITASEKMVDIFQTVQSVAASDYPVLVTGESGTGKELTARAVHFESRRKSGPFVSINCGALPENILESELFGHVRGAFTGAIKDKKGRFELANNGTLFLDEVGELTPAFQVKLLRVLQEGTFEKVGGETPISVDVRIVSATNRNLSEMVREGGFRQDLFYRLCVVPILLPPLKERKEDIPHLVEEFLTIINKESGKSIQSVSESAMNLLMHFHWPGNVRQLQNSLQFASIRCVGDQIEDRHLPSEVHRQAPQTTSPTAVPHRGEAKPAGKRKKLTVETVERALSETRGNKARAAKLLGVGRATLYRFINDHPNLV